MRYESHAGCDQPAQLFGSDDWSTILFCRRSGATQRDGDRGAVNLPPRPSRAASTYRRKSANGES
jgi:hypothetical protein